MKIAIILGFLFITGIITFVLSYFEVPVALYMPYIYWSLALLTFVLILPQKNESVFNELI